MTKQRSMVGGFALMGAALVVTACGGGGGNNGSFVLPVSGNTPAATTPPATTTPVVAKSVTGTFLDAAVEGLDYTSGTGAKAVTNAAGQFACKEGETVVFSAGAVALGSAVCGTTVTPLTLAGGTDIKTDAVVNRLLALQTLDEDIDPSNGIKLTAALDPTTETSKMYAYPIDGSTYSQDRTGNAKLGDLVSLGNGRFIVIEQGARKSDGKVFNKLMLVEVPANATNIVAFDQTLEVSSITQAVAGTADYSTVVTLKKTELLDLNALGWLAEKAEGLAWVDDNTLALVNDNDFGVATMLLDANGAKVAGSMEDCTVNAAGAIVSGCPAAAVGARITRGSDLERPTRVWLIKFDQKLSALRLPA